MLKRLKKASSVLLLVLMIVMIMVGYAANVSAESPMLYTFDTWKGSETTSVSFNGNYTRLLEIRDITTPLESKKIDSSKYTVTGDDKTTTITLNEDFLKTLENGMYSFVGYFKVDEFFLYPDTLNLENSNKSSLNLFFDKRDRFGKISHNGKDVAPSNYNVTYPDNPSDSLFIVEFNEDYLETIPKKERLFKFYSFDDREYYIAYFHLDIDVQETSSSSTSSGGTSSITSSEIPSGTASSGGTSSITSSEIPSGTSSSEKTSSTSSKKTTSKITSVSQSNSKAPNPKTGGNEITNDYGTVMGSLILMMLFAFGCAIVLIIVKKKKHQV